MKTSKSIFLVFSISLIGFLTGCATTKAPVTSSQQLALKRIGVLSLLPNELKYRKIGTTVFNNESGGDAIGNLLNESAFSVANNTLASSTRTIINVEADTVALANRIRSGILIIDSPIERIADEISKISTQHNLDAVLVITQSFDADNGVRGIEFFMRTAFGMDSPPVVRVPVSTVLVDTKAKGISRQGANLGFPVKNSSGRPWLYSLDKDLDEATKTNIKMIANEAVKATVKAQLTAMGLAN